MTLSIVAASRHGSAHKVARAIAASVHDGQEEQVIDADALDLDVLAAAQVVVIVSSIYKGTLEVIRQAPTIASLITQKDVALVTVGLTDPESDDRREAITRSELASHARSMTEFDLLGALEPRELGVTDRMLTRFLAANLKRKPVLTNQERRFINAAEGGIDLVDLAEIDPVLEWIDVHTGGAGRLSS
ncbi:flavodoxin domain-containing protein [Stomatohabitans albus]|uniref:flavodoxin domain-containing protein n=1 Tax=Stomatohabitans albus TaxID=3110766 RepID=UPI00300C825E